MNFMWGQGAKGLWVGALIGGQAGVWMWLTQDTLLFPGDAMLFGAIVCGVLGFLMGDTFFAWLKERWFYFIG